jgi:hypothetical protein
MAADSRVLVQPGHRVPELLLLQVQRGVVLAELVLAVPECVQDPLEVALCALVLAEVVLDLVPERDHPEQFLGPGGLLRVQVLDRTAELEQGLAHRRALGQSAALQRLHRRGQQPIGALRGVPDVRVAHAAHVGRLRGELGRARRGRHQRGEEGVDLRVQPGQRGRIHRRRQAGRGRRRDRLRRRGRSQCQDRLRRSGRLQRRLRLCGALRVVGFSHGRTSPMASPRAALAPQVASRSQLVRDAQPIYAVPGPPDLLVA